MLKTFIFLEILIKIKNIEQLNIHFNSKNALKNYHFDMI